MYLQKVISKRLFIAILKVTDEKSRIRYRYSEVRIRGSESVTDMSWIRNTANMLLTSLGEPLNFLWLFSYISNV
jgi:hypothetical protein